MKTIMQMAVGVALFIFLGAIHLPAQENSKGQELLKTMTDKNYEKAKAILDQDISLLEYANPRGSTLLTIAASDGASDMVVYLVGKGANVNAANNFGNTPLHYAAWASDLASFKVLREKGAKLETKNARGQTPLQYACMGGNPDILKECIREGMDIHAKIDDGSSLVHWAAYGGNISIFKYLESQGMDANTGDREGSPPLFWAATGKKTDMVKYLLEEKSADVNFRDQSGNTPVSSAVQSGSMEILEYLLQKGGSLDPTLEKNRTLMMLAAESNNPEMVGFLVGKGCEVNAYDDNGTTPLIIASAHGNLETVKALVKAGAKTNPGLCPRASCANTGSTALHAAAWNFPSVVEYLAATGADVNAKDFQGNTPLHSASRGDSTRSIGILCKAGGKVNAKNKAGLTPLMMAVQSQKTEAAQTLLACKADLAAADHEGKTALHFAAIAGDEKTVELLLKNGAKATSRDKKGRESAWYAWYYGNDKITETLRTNDRGDKPVPADMTGLLKKELKSGEAVAWYLNHSGWAVKTRNHLLVFDYWSRFPDATQPGLDNGRINPEEIAGNRVMVFASHSHADHYTPSIFNWNKEVGHVDYILGFNSAVSASYTYISPRTEQVVDGVRIVAIPSTDSGEGFLVEVDGVTILHPGDHANRQEEGDTAFYNGIDFLASSCRNIDIAFVPVTGCSFNNKVALEKGNDYIVAKLNPRLVLPMHGSGNETSYRDYADKKNKDMKDPVYQYALFHGDRFILPAVEVL